MSQVTSSILGTIHQIQQDRILTRKDFSTEFQLPMATVNYLVANNMVPFFRVGKRGVRFRWSRLMQWAQEEEGRESRLPRKDKGNGGGEN
jgi:hypothetical protein